MKSSVKWLFPVGLLIVLLVLLSACGSIPGLSPPPPQTPQTPQTALTNAGATAIIAYQAVPYIDYYLKQAGQPTLDQQVTASGDWNAVYQGEGVWRVEGSVMVVYPSGNKDCATAWTLNETDGTIKLVKFVCQ